MSGTDRFITVNGVKLHYAEHGDQSSPPLLCLHGVTLAGGVWDSFAAQMCDRYHVLALTARGHGDSDRADSYLGAVFVDDTAAFLEATGSAPATVCGHSMGGAIGIGLAAMHPEKVEKLIVVDAGPTPGGFRETLTEWLNSAPDSFDTVEEAVEQWKLMPGVGMDKVDVNELRRNVQLVMERGADGRLRSKTDPRLLQVLLGIGQPADTPSDAAREQMMWAACAAVKCPTLIVRGSRSTALTRECAERMLATIPDAQLVEVDAEHAIPQENPEGFHKVVSAFI